MTNWNDPQWLEDWYQLLESEGHTDDSSTTSADGLANSRMLALLERPEIDAALRQEAWEDWAMHQLLQDYYQAVGEPPPCSASVRHPECAVPSTAARIDLRAGDAAPIVIANERSSTKRRRRHFSASGLVWTSAALLFVAASFSLGYFYWQDGTVGTERPASAAVVADVTGSDSVVNTKNSSAGKDLESDTSEHPAPRLSPETPDTEPRRLAEVGVPPVLPIQQLRTIPVTGGKWLVKKGGAIRSIESQPGESGEGWSVETGRVDLELAGGTVLRLRGPAQVKRLESGDWSINEGTALILWGGVSVDANGPRVSISSRSVELNASDAASCFFSVQPNGESLVQVTAGRVQARSLAIDATTPWSLQADQRWQAHFWPSAAVRENGLLSAAPGRAVVFDRQGNFEGLIDVGGRVLPWSSPAVFGQVLDTAKTRMEQGDQKFVDQWKDLSQGWQQWQQLNPPGSGQTLVPPGREEFDAFMQRTMGPVFAEWRAKFPGIDLPENLLEPKQTIQPDATAQQHQTPWGVLDGQRLLVDQADDFE